jgi:hypothetical protein
MPQFVERASGHHRKDMSTSPQKHADGSTLCGRAKKSMIMIALLLSPKGRAGMSSQWSRKSSDALAGAVQETSLLMAVPDFCLWR